jgi:hypothetical protein
MVVQDPVGSTHFLMEPDPTDRIYITCHSNDLLSTAHIPITIYFKKKWKIIYTTFYFFDNVKYFTTL